MKDFSIRVFKTLLFSSLEILFWGAMAFVYFYATRDAETVEKYGYDVIVFASFMVALFIVGMGNTLEKHWNSLK